MPEAWTGFVPGPAVLLLDQQRGIESVIGPVLLCNDERGECAAYMGIDLAAIVAPREGEQLVWIDYHLLKDDILAEARRSLRQACCHFGFEFFEGRDHFVIRNLTDALIVLG